jgi:hypothetical protein
VSNVFFVITFSDLEAFDTMPKLKRVVVIADTKFSGIDLVAHPLFASFHLDQTASC